jgi:hypothetical protein
MRLVLLALPVIAWGALTLGQPPQPEARTRTPAAVSASTSGPAGGPEGGHPAPSASAGSAAPRGASDDAPPSDRGPAGDLAPAARPASAEALRDDGLRPHALDTRTLEASAADAAARGSFREAIALYDELALAHQEQPAYAAAAHILRRRHPEAAR